MRKVNIYCLKDPRCKSVRYIGKTITKLSDRLKVHINQSKSSKKPTYKEAWIKQLLFLDLKPEIELLQEVNELGWQEWEIIWIKTGKELGWNLTNLSIGGDGANGVKHSEEFKEKLRNRMRQNQYSVGVKWTEEQRELMKRRKTWNKGKRGVQNVSEETKQKMSESQKKAHARRKTLKTN